MRLAILSVAVLLVGPESDLAATVHHPIPARAELEVVSSSGDGCHAALTRFRHEAPYGRIRDGTYRLPNQQEQLISALRGLGSNRVAATVHGDAGIPLICSGYALEAVRLAGFQQIGFSLPPPPSEVAEELERSSACDVAADPARFRSQRIQVRGAVMLTMTPDGVQFFLIDLQCRRGFELETRQLELTHLFVGDLRHRLAEMVVTGSVAVSTCYLTPPGSTCGTRFNVERVEDVERPDLCWTYQRVRADRYEPIAVPCPDRPID